MLDLRLLEQYIAVAELEHVGRAAERLHISQSPLSRQIRHLEQQLGLDLFVRERKRLRLTPSGKWFLEEARRLLEHASRLNADVEQRAAGRAGALTVTFNSPAMWSGILPAALARYQSAFPNVVVNLHNLRSSAQIEGLRSGRIDIGFVSTPPGGHGWQVHLLSEESWAMVAPRSHPLIASGTLEPAVLAAAHWVVLPGENSGQPPAAFFEACAKAGFTPEVVRYVSEPMTLLALVQSGFGIGFIRESARNFAPQSLAFLPLPMVSARARTYMICSANPQPLAAAFTRFAA